MIEQGLLIADELLATDSVEERSPDITTDADKPKSHFRNRREER